MRRTTLTLILLSTLVCYGYAQPRERSEVPEKYTWDLTPLYTNDEAWKAAKELQTAEIPGLSRFRRTLGNSPEQLLACLDFYFGLIKEINRVALYASLSSDRDTRDSTYLAMDQEMTQVQTELDAASAFIGPEILSIGQTTVEAFLKAEPKLGIYRQMLKEIIRQAPHTGTEAEEKLIADAGLMSDAAGSVYNVFSNADFPYPEVILSNGKTVRLDKATYEIYRASSNREDRKKVFAAFFGRINDYRRTFGANLYAEVKKNMFYARASRYESALHRALDRANIPVQVYKSLVQNANDHLGSFQRYLRLRKRMLGVDTLHYYDLYAPLVKNVDLNYTVEESQKNIVTALAPLGKEYTNVLEMAFNNRWIDMYPTPGKRSGAYNNGSAYDAHPYMLMNYNGKYKDMKTLAHELGHAMQSYLSNKKQPYPTARYPAFTAEVASTFNEALLHDYMLKQIKDNDAKLSVLGSYLEGIKGTVFRQAQFAEFELRMHEMAERGEALTGDKLNGLYEEITKKYYGHDARVCIVDDEIKAEWAYVPHFYYNFYVYQYATSFTASAALSEKVMEGDKAALNRYQEFLSAGSSDYAIDLLKKAGVDMTTATPFESTMRKMNRVMDEMEDLLDAMGR